MQLRRSTGRVVCTVLWQVGPCSTSALLDGWNGMAHKHTCEERSLCSCGWAGDGDGGAVPRASCRVARALGIEHSGEPFLEVTRGGAVNVTSQFASKTFSRQSQRPVPLPFSRSGGYLCLCHNPGRRNGQTKPKTA